MKITEQILCGFDGEPILIDAAKKGEPAKKQVEFKPFTLKDACLMACSSGIPDDDKLPPMGKVEIGMIGVAIAKGVDITHKQVTTLQERAEKMFLSPEWVWAIHEALESLGSEKAAKPVKK